MSFPASHRSPCRPGPRGELESDLIVSYHRLAIICVLTSGGTLDPTHVHHLLV